jgi:hypothetical protein
MKIEAGFLFLVYLSCSISGVSLKLGYISRVLHLQSGYKNCIICLLSDLLCNGIVILALSKGLGTTANWSSS